MEILQLPDMEWRALDALVPADPEKSLRLGTLGPRGTSSEYIAQSMSSILRDRGPFEIVLNDTYEGCMEALSKGQVDLALVAHAYQKINAFYMNPRLEPAIVFRGHTPEYGLATRADFEFREEMLFKETIVSHPAPVPLLRYHFEHEVQVDTSNSTSQAARDVADGLYDIAITNEQAVRQHNLKFVYKFSRIPMTWTVFSRRAQR
ncbi:type 2 periplasmic-binding domain-containing protein [Streptomyces xanthophaeus]|uniref:hypothetical protein n=1 Tax=Streptomyces xanthophaeus TaxID=67385 RepID=UPI0037198D16